ncbi:MAG: indolepyruvate oxidoreductase subunit beta [Calditrichaeota bacterium]|nr:MAG: indolepyruvate oxidoreductase subunit beta [Calditrichota bacterium]
MQQQIVNVLLCGVGGQGILKASQILAESAMMSGYDVKKAEVHGMSQRGGSVVSHVRFGARVYSPLISLGEADFILAFEPLEALRNLSFIHSEGVIILNEEKIMPQSVRAGQAEYPKEIIDPCVRAARETIATHATHAAEQLGNRRVTNILMLGILSKFLPFSEETWQKAIQKNVPPKTVELNLKAFRYGRQLIEQPDRVAKFRANENGVTV